MSGVNEIRSSFLDFFAKNGHEIVPSSPLVPRNDPTLMFTNAGMVQFKNVFTGVEKRPYQRATTSQKCVRAGGKHNDLDNVGYTARHHTFFEMLGNFSFGDYFKDRAIELAWNLVTKEFGLPKDKLTATVYIDDDEAFDLWKKIAGLPESRIIRIAGSDNFWQMGDTGPCGPCSEIFYDHGDKIWGGPPGSPEQDGDRFIEIWNLVFMQYEQLEGGVRNLLPKPSIDTGAGLERVAAVLQGKHDNYDIDLFVALIRAIAELTGADPQGPQKASLRVIADHLRAVSFLIADGVLPSSDGRGYVLRRILRRAIRHAQLLGSREPLMWRLVRTLVREMGQAYPELLRAERLIEQTLRLEEVSFRKTLERGISLLEDEVVKVNATPQAGTAPVAITGTMNVTEPSDRANFVGKVLPGNVAFTLYDTFGFPLDLTQDALRAKGMSVDVAGFDAAMNEQRAKARAAWAGSGDIKTADYWFPLREKFGATEFLGYETESAEAVVQAVIKGGPQLPELPAGWAGELIFNQTPFYAESGGQVSDIGWIRRVSDGEIIADVLICHKEAGDLIVHNVQMHRFPLKVGDAVRLEVNSENRAEIRRNHSATHLLHEALRQVLGDHVAQRGSRVEPEKLRFDFSHPSPISPSQLARVEDLANKIVLQNVPVETRLMDVNEAIESGARALFGEKYGDEVRVVSMGEPDGNAHAWSVELCGGTHVRRTGDIGLISIISEGGVSSGVRRIEALTGNNARQHANATMGIAKTAAAELRTTIDDVPARIAVLMEERKKLERDLSDARKKLAMGGGASVANGSAASASGIREVGNVKLMARSVEGIEMKDLKSLVDDGKKQIGSGVVAIVAVTEDGKAGIVVGVTSDLTSRFNAVELVRKGSEALGGKGGGGRPDMAQAGGPDGAKAAAALSAIERAMAGT